MEDLICELDLNWLFFEFFIDLFDGWVVYFVEYFWECVLYVVVILEVDIDVCISVCSVLYCYYLDVLWLLVCDVYVWGDLCVDFDIGVLMLLLLLIFLYLVLVLYMCGLDLILGFDEFIFE